jgi:hypothetical protein
MIRVAIRNSIEEKIIKLVKIRNIEELHMNLKQICKLKKFN